MQTPPQTTCSDGSNQRPDVELSPLCGPIRDALKTQDGVVGEERFVPSGEGEIMSHGAADSARSMGLMVKRAAMRWSSAAKVPMRSWRFKVAWPTRTPPNAELS